MSDLFAILSSTTRAMDAQRAGLDVTGQNIANVNTPGYTRRTTILAAVPPYRPDSVGGGADVLAVQAQRNELLDTRLQAENGSAGRYGAMAETLTVFESDLGPADQQLDARLNAFFDSVSRLTQNPSGPAPRQDVASEASALAAAFNKAASQVDALRHDADRRIGTAVDDVTRITQRLAAINKEFPSGSDSANNSRIDEQAKLLKELSALIDINVIQRKEGGVDVDAGTGQPLVVGATAYPVQAPPVGANGLRTITIDGTDVTALISGGRLGGLLQARDGAAPQYQQKLDDQAAALATAFNALHTTGIDLNGNPGQPFFTYAVPVVGNAGAAAALRVNAAITADPRMIAAGATAAAGDNDVARQLTGLRDAKLLANGTATLTESWAQFVYAVGSDVKNAKDESAAREQAVSQIEALQGEVSGVSLDEEAMNLMKFQRAYEANARVFQVIDSALDTLLNLVR